ncbi:hypothetical protein AAE02nite_21440 [Adhaeribacter aerolatus]|uniref:DUF433 domain-containing protein n=1 Tax=Adhaeribacter aerolatus TaxID=670289 RepID=A0A512AXR5_9BACT|nr:DUF433 domain-containing protein [Adhaeribacter aerolatus]GEO04480.1 hypothetical protein AAE02nite_21440 [Adhaeribacter aerolatus]
MIAYENKPQLGGGIYTIPDIAQILRVPTNKANRWINTYWEEKLGKEFNHKYSWNLGQTKAVSFHTLIELYVFYQFNRAGVKPNTVLHAHQILSKRFNTLFPFANEKVLASLKTDGRRIYLNHWNEIIVTLDSTNQLNLDFIKLFFKLVDFDEESTAKAFWPLGKVKSIVCDPKRQFGHPVIADTNIYPESIYNLFKAGEPISFISQLYEITEKQVEDAIEYCIAA